MNCSQKISNARSNVAAFIPALADTINSITFRETGVLSGMTEIPPMYLAGPQINYVKSKVEELTHQQVTYQTACFAFSIHYVLHNEDRMKDVDPMINMLATTLYAQSLLKEYPDHSFQPYDEWNADWDKIEGMSVADLYDGLMKDPYQFGEFVGKWVEENQSEDEGSENDEEMLKEWLDDK